MVTSAPRPALYYPFIQFRSDAWLKLAALYWDKIGRIVPKGYLPRDSDTVRRLQGELDLITDLEPAPHQTDSSSLAFVRMIKSHEAELRQKYGLSQFDRDQSDWHPAWPPSWSNAAPPPDRDWSGRVDPSLLSGSDPRLSYIHSAGKMSDDLQQAVVSADLGVRSDNGLIGMHPEFAFVYMHSLANAMSSRAMPLVTDDDFDHLAAGCGAGNLADVLLRPYGDDPVVTDPNSLGVDLAMIAIRSVIPRNIETVPVRKIVDIRKRFRAELTSFQDSTNAVIEGVAEAAVESSPDVQEMVLKSLYEREYEPELMKLKTALSRSGIDSAFGAVSIKAQMPQLATSSAALVGLGAFNANPTVIGAGAIALCLTPTIRDQRAKARSVRAESSAAYLLRLEENLTPVSLAGAMARNVKRFLTG